MEVSEKINFKEWLKESEEIMSQLPDASKVSYTACVLQKYSQTSLVTAVQKWMFETTGSGIPKGWVVRAHHMTVKFRPLQADIQAVASLLGKEIELDVEGWASDNYGVAVIVKPKTNFPLGNDVPHITIAHSREVGPVYSNTLLADRSKWTPVDTGLTLMSELVCVLRDNTTIPSLVNPAASTF